MVLRERRLAGLDYLAAVTRLLQNARLVSPAGGVWEAADLQWWWRRDQHPDPDRLSVWFDRDEPVAAVVVTDWGDRFGCDLIAARHDLPAVVDVVWNRAAEQIDLLGDAIVEMTIRDDETMLIDLVAAAGFRATEEAGVECWMNAADRPAPSPAIEGFTLLARSEVSDRPHHMIRRNGERVAERLDECSLYRPDLDLVVYDTNQEVAAYGLAWVDTVTGIGLIEPMRTEDRYQRRGLGRWVLTAALGRLAAHGCSRFKVTYLTDNEASRHLYLGAGFVPGAVSRTYRRGGLT